MGDRTGLAGAPALGAQWPEIAAQKRRGVVRVVVLVEDVLGEGAERGEAQDRRQRNGQQDERDDETTSADRLRSSWGTR